MKEYIVIYQSGVLFKVKAYSEKEAFEIIWKDNPECQYADVAKIKATPIKE